ncbi:MAG: hypothetical protein VKJ24_18800 [Synechococcales bacterium]|nr:hypothetical protein [Synechococcales bacterium]
MYRKSMYLRVGTQYSLPKYINWLSHSHRNRVQLGSVSSESTHGNPAQKLFLTQTISRKHHLQTSLSPMRRPVSEWSIVLNLQFEECKQELIQVDRVLSTCLNTAVAEGQCYLTAGEFRNTLSRLQRCLTKVERNIAELQLYKFGTDLN